MNFDGILIGICAVFLIWFGHFWVVRLFQWKGTKLWVLPLLLGIIFIVVSLFVEETMISAIASIAAITFFWGIKELFEYGDKHNQNK